MREILLSSEILELTSLINFIDSSKLLIDKLDGSRATVETSPSSKIIENLVVLLVLKKQDDFFYLNITFFVLFYVIQRAVLKVSFYGSFFIFFFFIKTDKYNN